MVSGDVRTAGGRLSLAELLLGVALAMSFLALLVVKAPPAHRGVIGLAGLVVLGAVAIRDVQTRRAPNTLVYPALPAMLVGALTLGQPELVEALLGGIAALGILLVVALAGRGAMGAGDVKVGALCGVIVGIHGVVPMLAATFISGAIVAGLLLLTGSRRREDTIAFTPFLVGGTLAAMAWYRLYLWS
jgi:prepilin signal peptidase PulO-like enzyme (type II secretory pathway)